MESSYATGLVALSVLIASLASYVAIEFAGRIEGPQGRRRSWLVAGALAMGSGIWSMHFVGMAALELPVALSFDLGITALSWVAAVVVSALALVLVTGSGLSLQRVLGGALAMGLGICLMHYGGMWAMRMDPGIGYDPLWFGISVLIAVTASAAALLVVSRLKQVQSWRDIGLRLGAAGVMGLAVAGMHYSGMAAAQFAPGAFCSPANALSADFITWPVVVVSLIGLGLALVFAIGDAREVLRRERAARAEARQVESLAFLDAATGLPNRARLAQWVAERLARGERFGLLSLGAGGIGRDGLVAVAKALESLGGPGVRLARSGHDQFGFLVDSDTAEAVLGWARTQVLPVLRPLQREGLKVSWGLALAPADGSNAQMLLLRATAREPDLEALHEVAEGGTAAAPA